MENNTPKNLSDEDIMKAHANQVARKSGLFKEPLAVEVTDDDINKFLKSKKLEQKESLEKFIEEKEQLSFNIDEVSAPLVKINLNDIPDFVPENPVVEPTGENVIKTGIDVPVEKSTVIQKVEIVVPEKSVSIEDVVFVPEKEVKEPTGPNVIHVGKDKPAEPTVDANGDIELRKFLLNGFADKFENGVIDRDAFIVFETSADFIGAIPSETRHIFAKQDDQGVTKFIEIKGEDKNAIRTDYPELEDWVVVKQVVRDTDDFDDTKNAKLADKIESMIHSKKINKVDLGTRIKEMEEELNEVKNIENKGIITEVDEDKIKDAIPEPKPKKEKKQKEENSEDIKSEDVAPKVDEVNNEESENSGKKPRNKNKPAV